MKPRAVIGAAALLAIGAVGAVLSTPTPPSPTSCACGPGCEEEFTPLGGVAVWRTWEAGGRNVIRAGKWRGACVAVACVDAVMPEACK